MKAVQSDLFKLLTKKYAPHEIHMAMASGTPLELGGKKYIIEEVYMTQEGRKK